MEEKTRKFAVMLYPDFSLQEITCLTSVLTVWFGEKIDFIEKENFIHKGVVTDGNVITGIGMFFREFAEAVLKHFEYDFGTELMTEKAADFSEEQLTFYWSDEDYQEFLEELKDYQK